MNFSIGRRFGTGTKMLRNLVDRPPGPRIFGVGAAKTGTHTLGEMFADQVPSAHEMDAERLIGLYLRSVQTGHSGALRRYMRLRDLARGLRIDASQVNIYLLPHLETLFPHSRYVLTVRDPRVWLRSIIDDSLRRTVSPVWMAFRTHRFAGVPFTAQDAPLEHRGLYPLQGYLNYWRFSIDTVLRTVPPERLMVVRTEDLNGRGAEIARFCGLAPGQGQGVHSFANSERFGVLEELDPGYLDAAIAAVMDDDTRAMLRPAQPAGHAP